MKPKNYIFNKFLDDVDATDLVITSGNHWLIILGSFCLWLPND